MIAAALSMGVSKRELFETYYMDEFIEVCRKYNEIKHPGDEEIICGNAVDFMSDS